MDDYRRRLDENPLYVEEVMFAEGHEHILNRLKGRIAPYLGGKPEERRSPPGGFCAFEHLFAMDAAFALQDELGRARVAAGVMVSPEEVETTLREIRAIAA